MINNNFWRILEHHDIEKVCRRLPPQVIDKYDLWKELVREHGPEGLRRFAGWHDEKLKGSREGQRSSRLNLQYRVIYSVRRDVLAVLVIEITPHKY